MTPKERKVVFTLIGVMFLIMVSVIVMKSSKGAKNNDTAQNMQESETQNMSDFMQNAVNDNTNNIDTDNTENTDVNNTDDTTVNNNTSRVKTYKTLIITNIEYQNNNVGNKIVADIKNVGNTNFTSEVAKLTLITSSGEKIETTIIIPSLEADETAKLEHILDLDNVIDFIIEEI